MQAKPFVRSEDVFCYFDKTILFMNEALQQNWATNTHTLLSSSRQRHTVFAQSDAALD